MTQISELRKFRICAYPHQRFRLVPGKIRIEARRYQFGDKGTPVTEWLRALTDGRARAHIVIRLRRVIAGTSAFNLKTAITPSQGPAKAEFQMPIASEFPSPAWKRIHTRAAKRT